MKTISFSKWEMLSEEQQNSYIAEGILPYVSLADLRNCLLKSRMIIVDGERCWKIERSNGNIEIHPERITKTNGNITMWCRFNPVYGDYRMKTLLSELLRMESIDFGDSHWNIWLVGND